MPRSICDTGKTILDFADTRLDCRRSPAYIGIGNVETTPIGFVRNGANVQGFLPEVLPKSKCRKTPFKAVEGPC